MRPEDEEGWAWMKGVTNVHAAAPIDPVAAASTKDNRPVVLDLIEKNKKEIGEIRQELEKDPLYIPKKHDDLWIVRFFLSQKKVKSAVKAAKYTLQFRKKHNLDAADIRDQRVDKNVPSPALAKYLSHCDDDAITFSIPDKSRSVMHYIRIAGVKQHDLVNKLTGEEWLSVYSFFTEWSFQWLDYITRTTGRLTKMLRLIDLKGLKLSMLNMEGLTRDGKAMGEMEDCYPQALHSIKLCNAPVWIQVPWRIVRPIMPKRVVSKIDFIMPERSERDRNTLYKFIEPDKLPSRFGGQHSAWPAPVFF